MTPEVISAVVAQETGRKAHLWIVSLLMSVPDRADVVAVLKALSVPEVQGVPLLLR